MSGLAAVPELLTSAATDLGNIGSTLNVAHAAAAASTTTVLPAAADEVSSGIAQLFSTHAQSFQALAGQAASFHSHFMQNLTASAGAYAHAEATSAAALAPLGAIAGSVASVAAAPASLLTQLTAWWDAIETQVQLAIGSLLWFIFAPILVPIIDAFARVIADAIVGAIFGSL